MGITVCSNRQCCVYITVCSQTELFWTNNQSRYNLGFHMRKIWRGNASACRYSSTDETGNSDRHAVFSYIYSNDCCFWNQHKVWGFEFFSDNTPVSDNRRSVFGTGHSMVPGDFTINRYITVHTGSNKNYRRAYRGNKSFLYGTA